MRNNVKILRELFFDKGIALPANFSELNIIMNAVRAEYAPDAIHNVEFSAPGYDKMLSEMAGGMPETDAIHRWFELSYAEYLTIPRSVLQSMPEEWQRKFVALLEELDETIDWRPEEGCYWVKLKDSKGRYISDLLGDYERGRRKIPHINNK